MVKTAENLNENIPKHRHGCGHDVGRRADGRGVAAEVGAERECPGDHAQIHALRRRDGLNDRHHGGRERDVVDQRTAHGREQQDDDDDGLDAAAADARDELRDELEHAGLLQSRDGDEQADEKQQRLVVHAAQHFLHAGAAVGAHGHEQRQRCDDHADARDGQPGLRVRHEQRDRDEKHDHIRNERLAVGDGGRRGGADSVGRTGGLARLERLAEAQPEEHQHEHKADADDDAGVFNEVREGIAERGADDDVGGIAAHGGGATEVGTEDLRQDHRNGVKAQDLRQLQRDGREKQHDRDAVDEHGQKRRHGHEAQQQRHDVVVRELCQRQAQPAEEAGFAETLDHNHHTGDEEDG